MNNYREYNKAETIGQKKISRKCNVFSYIGEIAQNWCYSCGIATIMANFNQKAAGI